LFREGRKGKREKGGKCTDRARRRKKGEEKGGKRNFFPHSRTMHKKEKGKVKRKEGLLHN